MRNRPLLLGHRGARSTRSIPENTIASFDLALQHGCDGFEFDVRLAGDSHAVICHDPEISGMRVASSAAHDLSLPTLNDVIARYAESAFLDIELKVSGVEQLTVSSLRTRTTLRGVLVSSFLPAILLCLRQMAGELPLGIICETREQLASWPELPVQYVIPRRDLITPALVAEIHDRHKRLFAWTVNDPVTMRTLRGWGVDGIISDETELLVRTLGGDQS
ncbi:MAG TPA: glycerophosphodiester phosphodiesterase [Terriglobales bacterium]|nr:glycerophosphodiester phosphodiesterase [Terriglobales bacterium]